MANGKTIERVGIGLGRFDKSPTLELTKEGTEVLGIDADLKIVSPFPGWVAALQ